MISIDRELLQHVFDIAVHSMDFGSGFLDDEEVSALREIADLLDVDPDAATLSNYKCKYRGWHYWESDLPRGKPQERDWCRDCKMTRSWPER